MNINPKRAMDKVEYFIFFKYIAHTFSDDEVSKVIKIFVTK